MTKRGGGGGGGRGGGWVGSSVTLATRHLVVCSFKI